MWKTWTGGPEGAPISSPGAAGGAVQGAGGWHPTVLYLAVLLFAEMVAVAFLTRTLR